MSRSWHLEDAFEIAKEAKYTFYIPSTVAIKKLKIGNLAKLIFLFESDDPTHPRAERMWVKITDISGEIFKGKLDNEPFFIKDLNYQDELEFQVKHIIDLDIEDPIESIVEKYVHRCLATKKIIDEKIKVKYLYREESMGELKDGIVDSGWRIFAGDETQKYLDNPDNSQFVSLGFILNIDDTILPFLENEIDAELIWNDETKKFEED